MREVRAGFHLENLSRGGKMDSKILWGGNGIACYSVPSRGVWGHAPRFFS